MKLKTQILKEMVYYMMAQGQVIKRVLKNKTINLENI